MNYVNKHNIFVISMATFAFVSGIVHNNMAEAKILPLQLVQSEDDESNADEEADPPATKAVIADHYIEYKEINREESLEALFEKYDSPLKGKSKVFIEVADKYNLDYRLLPAIAGMESTFCKRILPKSYNCWGWGIHGNNAIYFNSFEEGIEKVGKGIHDGYTAKGLDTPEKMARVYTPPNPHNWLKGVTKFMNEIENINNKENSPKLVVK